MSLLVLSLLACDAPVAPPQTSALVAAGPPAGAPTPPTATGSTGATVYVPVYSSIYVGEGDTTFDLTITLSVRNTDATRPIHVSAVDYHDAAGARVHAYVDGVTTLAPFASADTVVRASDTRAGVGGSFLVRWHADGPVSDPIVEAVMIGSSHQQGISFVTRGQVLPAPPPGP